VAKKLYVGSEMHVEYEGGLVATPQFSLARSDGAYSAATYVAADNNWRFENNSGTNLGFVFRTSGGAATSGFVIENTIGPTTTNTFLVRIGQSGGTELFKVRETAITLGQPSTVTTTTDATSSTNGGALTVSGGAAIAKKLYVGETVACTNLISTKNSVFPVHQYTGNQTLTFDNCIVFLTGGTVTMPTITSTDSGYVMYLCNLGIADTTLKVAGTNHFEYNGSEIDAGGSITLARYHTAICVGGWNGFAGFGSWMVNYM
jgi:hypothetical protein